MADNKENTGAIFKNDKKSSANHPDYRGVVNANGKDMEIALWLKESKTGKKYFSVSLSEPYQTDAQASGDKSLKQQDDDLPF